MLSETMMYRLAVFVWSVLYLSMKISLAVYIHSNGIDDENCGAQLDNACGTLYYGTHNNHSDLSNIYIYGQNETEITSYFNQFIEYHPCLMVPVSLMNSNNNNNEMNIIFDDDHIKSMNDWYPSVCNDYINNKSNNKYLFQFDDPYYTSVTIINLYVEDLMFYGDTYPFGIIHSIHPQTEIYCQQCTFYNISAKCKIQQYNSIIYGFIGFNDVTINHINYTLDSNSNCTSSSFIYIATEQASIYSANMKISNIYMNYNFFGMQRTEYLMDYVIMDNIYCQNSFIDDVSSQDLPQSKILKPFLTNCSITNFYGSSIFKSSQDFTIDFTIKDCDIQYIAENQHNSMTDSLFSFGSGWYIMDNVAITYKYDLIKNCIISDTFIDNQYVNDFIVVNCSNPISAVRSSDDAEINLLKLFFDVNYELYQQFIYNNNNWNNAENMNINYRFYQQITDYTQFTDALIINFDDMIINQLIVSPTTFHDMFLLDLGEDFVLKQFIVTHNGSTPIYNLLTSNNLYRYDSRSRSAADAGSQKQFIDCYFYGTKETLIYIDTTLGENIVIIENAIFSDASVAIYTGIGPDVPNYDATSSITVYATDFTNIGTRYLDLYTYYFSSFTNDSVNKFNVLNSVNFTNCKLDTFSDGHLIEVKESENVILVDNVFTANIDNIAWIDDDKYPLIMTVSLVNIQISTNLIHIVSNKFDNISYLDANVASLYLYSNKGRNCLTGNIFYNYALSLKDTNISSCYRPDASIIHLYDHMATTLCDNHIGGIHPDLADLFTYWYLDHPYLNPIHIENGEYAETVIMDNIIFVLIGARNAVFYPDISTTDKPQNQNLVNFLFYDMEIRYINNNENRYNVLSNYSNNTNFCKPACKQQLVDEGNQTNIDYFKQIHIVCNAIPASSNDHDHLHGETEYINHLIPSYIELIPNNNNYKYFPGQTFTLFTQITDRFRNVVENYTSDLSPGSIIWNEPYNNTITLDLHYDDEYSTSLGKSILIDTNGVCYDLLCDQTILTDVTLQDVENDTIIHGKDLSQSLNVFDLMLNITNCPSGYKISATGLYCNECPNGQFSLYANSKSCFLCPENSDAVKCEGGNKIIVVQNYWMTIADNNNNDNELRIVTGLCPAGYCCVNGNGCYYFQNIVNDTYGTSELCALHRNVHEYLCGKCIEGYSEVYGTANCQKCERNYYERLLIPIIYGFLWSIFILFTRSKKISPPQNVQQKGLELRNKLCCFHEKAYVDTPELTRKEYLDTLEITISKIILYYYQSISYVLLTSGLQIILSGFVNLFNLNIFSITTSNTETGICLLKEMTAPQKIAFELTTTLSIVFFIFFAYLLSLCRINVCFYFKRTPNFPQSMVKAMLICVGQILGVLLQLLACKEIGNISVHFYFASYECYGFIWTISAMSLLIIILSFLGSMIIIWFRIRQNKSHLSDIIKKDKDKGYYPIIWCYDRKYWYWEYILFLRRCILALIFIVWNNDMVKTCIAILLIIYLFIHIKCNPFQLKYVNALESYLIASIAIIIFIDTNNTKSNQQYHTFNNTIISLLILFPICWYIFFIFFQCKSLLENVNSTHKPLQSEDVEMAATYNIHDKSNKYDDNDDDDDDDHDGVSTVASMPRPDGHPFTKKISNSIDTKWSTVPNIHTDTENDDELEALYVQTVQDDTKTV